jgi:hypothetical protein
MWHSQLYQQVQKSELKKSEKFCCRFSMVFQTTQAFLKQVTYEKYPCLGVKISHNKTVKYATIP